MREHTLAALQSGSSADGLDGIDIKGEIWLTIDRFLLNSTRKRGEEIKHKGPQRPTSYTSQRNRLRSMSIF